MQVHLKKDIGLLSELLVTTIINAIIFKMVGKRAKLKKMLQLGFVRTRTYIL